MYDTLQHQIDICLDSFPTPTRRQLPTPPLRSSLNHMTPMTQHLKIPQMMKARLSTRTPRQRHNMIHLQPHTRTTPHTPPIPTQRSGTRKLPHMIPSELRHAQPATPTSLPCSQPAPTPITTRVTRTTRSDLAQTKINSHQNKDGCSGSDSSFRQCGEAHKRSRCCCPVPLAPYPPISPVCHSWTDHPRPASSSSCSDS